MYRRGSWYYSDHCMASKRSEYAGARVRSKHARMGVVGAPHFKGNDGGQRQQRPRLHRAGSYAAATTTIDQRDPYASALVHLVRAIGLKAGMAPMLPDALGRGSALDQAPLMHTCSPHVNTSTR